MKNDKQSQLGLEKAGIDLGNARTQLILGLILVGVLLLLNVYPLLKVGLATQEIAIIHALVHTGENANSLGSEPVRTSLLSQITLFCDSCVWQNNPIGYRITNLVLYFVAVLLIALICFEWTGRFGNRLGAAAPLWAAILFGVYPRQAEMIASIAMRQYELNDLFILLGIYGFLRWLTIRENNYMFLGWAALLLLLGNTFEWGGKLLPYDQWGALINRLQALFFPVIVSGQATVCSVILFWAYIILAVLALLRIAFQMVRPTIFIGLIAFLVLPFLVPWHGLSNSLFDQALLYGAIPFSLLLCLMALPCTDTSKRSLAKVTGTLGLIILLVITLTWTFLLHLNQEALIAQLNTPRAPATFERTEMQQGYQ